jgi:predicted nucleic acid binding AN1-type Zn finger protein
MSQHSTAQVIQVKQATQSKQSNRCSQCNKKLGIMEYICKCEKRFCISHLQPQEHGCTFDYRKEASKEIQKIMDSEPRACSFERI